MPKEFRNGRHRKPVDRHKEETITLKVDETFLVPDRPVHGKGPST